MKKLQGIWVGLLLPALLVAQEPAEEDAEVRRYTVEFIIFKYVEDVGVGTEIFPPEAPPGQDAYPPLEQYGDEGPIFTDVPIESPAAPREIEAPAAAADLDETGGTGSRLDLVLSLDDALTLDDVLGRLERLDVYEPLLYGGWTQATVSKEEAESLDLALFGAPPSGLEGSFTLYLGRFLHLVVDLTLDATATEGTAVPDEPAFSFGDSRFGFENDPFAAQGRVLLRIEEDRIMKNGDIRYFDHPRFGVIAKVTRVEPAEEPAEDGAPLIGGLRE